MKTRILFIIVVCLLCVKSSFAQTNDLSQEDMEQLLKQTQLKVNQFNSYVAFIAKREKYSSQQQQNEMNLNKDEYIRQALKLFVGGGRDYYDDFGNLKSAPVMQVSCIQRNGKIRVTDKPIQSYLQRLKFLNYTNVTVTAGDAFFCSEARQIGENKYVATLSFRQYFVGKRDGLIVYQDKTDKTVTVYIEKKLIDGKSMWTILLGDIKVDATEQK